jgi:hypothetical protein
MPERLIVWALMQLALYKGPASDFWHKVGHQAICLWTDSPYSHCELVFGQPGDDGTSLCGSSSSRDGGVRLKLIDLSSGHWDLQDLPLYSPQEEQYALQWFIDHTDAKYDWLGLPFFVIPIRAEDRKRWFCSEACAAALRYHKPYQYTPKSLAYRLE